MAPEHKAGQKRKRVPYEGRKSTRKPIKFKKQEYYNSSSSEDDEPMPRWRNNLKPDAIAKESTSSSSDDEGIELPNVIEAEAEAENSEAAVPDTAPITFADLVKPAGDELQEGESASDDSDLPDIENFDPLAPVHLSDDEISEAASDASANDLPIVDVADSSDSDVDEFDIDSDDAGTTNASTTTRALRKRNDPTAFAASISAILGSKLTTTKRADPILARSATAAATAKELAEDKLEAKARRKLRADKHNMMEKGRVRDVLGLEKSGAEEEASTGAIMELENRLRKTAQKGVIQLFNAVRAAQMKGFEAEVQAKKEGQIGIDGRKERVTEMSKKGFLDLLAGGGAA